MPGPPPGDATDEDISVDSLIRALARLPSTPRSPRELAQSLHETHFQRFAEVTRGRYELHTLLGAGGMGIVYDGKNLRTQRAVAIKFLRLRPDETAQVQRERALRFVREASAAGRIRHPNVVDIYDVEADVATPYLVMERLEGESLRDRITRGRIAPREAVNILTEAMRGVVEAHQHGVIHRDLKPDNIFLARSRGREGRVVKVLDFGVSRLLTSDGSARPSALTGAGHLLGTPAYMPLEQLRGDPDCDARVDVYALGVTLYEALCGQRPTNAPATDFAPLAQAGEVVPPAARCADVDDELSAIVMRSMNSQREARYADVRSFALALEGWLARTASADPKAARPPRREASRFKVAIYAGTLSATVALLGWLSHEPTRAVPAHEERAPSAQATGPAALPAGEQTPPSAQPLVQQPRPAEKPEAQSALEARPLPDAGAAPKEGSKRRRGVTKARGRERLELRDPSPLTDPTRALELRSAEF